MGDPASRRRGGMGKTIRWAAASCAMGLGCGDGGSTASGGSGSADASADDGSASEGAPVTETSAGSASATAATQDGTAADSTADDDDSADDAPIFDVGALGDTPEESCECGFDDWSYLFVSNSTEATLSKINTRTLTEEGRYRTRPDGSGNPSRTSVSIDGKAVVVANRMGGVTKFWSRP